MDFRANGFTPSGILVWLRACIQASICQSGTYLNNNGHAAATSPHRLSEITSSSATPDVRRNGRLPSAADRLTTLHCRRRRRNTARHRHTHTAAVCTAERLRTGEIIAGRRQAAPRRGGAGRDALLQSRHNLAAVEPDRTVLPPVRGDGTYPPVAGHQPMQSWSWGGKRQRHS